MKSNRIYAWLGAILLTASSAACSSSGPTSGETGGVQGSGGTSNSETATVGPSGEATETAVNNDDAEDATAPDGGGTTTEAPVDDPTTPDVGGSTSAGNPITFDIGGAKAFAVTNEVATTTSTNLKKLVGDNFVEVLSVTDATASSAKSLGRGAKATLTGTTLPEITHIESGPLGEVVLGLSKAITVNEQPCRLIRLSGTTTATAEIQCVGIAGLDAKGLWDSSTWIGDQWKKVPAMRDRVQFDAAGNIYYIAKNQGANEVVNGKASATEAITRWQVSDGTFTQYVQGGTAGDRYLLNFQVLSDGLIFYSAMLPNNYSAFRYVTNDTIVTAEIAGDVFFADQSTQQLFAVSLWPAGLYAVPYTADGFGTPQSLLGKDHWIGTPGKGIDGSELGYFERLTDGTIFGLPVVARCSAGQELGESCSALDQLVHVYPGDPAVITPPLSAITYFKAIDDDLYLSGTAEDAAHDFIRMDVDDPDGALHFFPDEDIQLLHFVKIDDVIYFDARRMSEKAHFFGKIDLSQGTAYQELSALQAEILDLKALF